MRMQQVETTIGTSRIIQGMIMALENMLIDMEEKKVVRECSMNNREVPQ
jgi:hypothetical protein